MSWGSGRDGERSWGEVSLVGRPVVEARVRTARVVEGEVTAQASGGGGNRIVRVQIDLLVLERAPEPLDEDVIASSLCRPY